MGRWSGGAVAGAMAVAAAASLAGCGTGPGGTARSTQVQAVGAEDQYADVVAQVGGPYVHVVSVLDDPSTDPHTFESSPRVAQEVGAAQLVVQNGLGYDDFMNRIEAATPSPTRRVVVVQRLLGLPDSTPNPHLWYGPRTMPAVARAVADDLAALRPAHAAYFRAQLTHFLGSLTPWLDAVHAFARTHGGAPVAATEPVADYLLEAMGTRDRTPERFQVAVMNGVDPSPQDVATVTALLSGHKVAVLCYNEQVTSALTAGVLATARRSGVPVVGVYETMPSGYHYQRWMLAETEAVVRAVTRGTSTSQL